MRPRLQIKGLMEIRETCIQGTCPIQILSCHSNIIFSISRWIWCLTASCLTIKWLPKIELACQERGHLSKRHKIKHKFFRSYFRQLFGLSQTYFTKVTNSMVWGGLSSVCTKFEPARSRSKEILGINVSQKFSVHHLCKSRENRRCAVSYKLEMMTKNTHQSSDILKHK